MLQKVALVGLVMVVAGLGLGAGPGGCGSDLDWSGDWDATCYDCRTVCGGTEDDVLDSCLSSCWECQGYGACFAWLDGEYEGMDSMSKWEQVGCDDID